jgi:phosphatidylglycerophosphate synthase
MTEGELWARELLIELRAGRFCAAAWVRFFRRSFERAETTRRARTREHRTVVLLAASGAAAWTAAGLAVLGPVGAAGAAWWLSLCLMLDWHLGMLERPDGRPLAGLGLANTLALLRIGVAPAPLLVSRDAAGVLLLVAGMTDAIDGPLARRREEVTRLGRWLDGAADSSVLGAAALTAPLPGWVRTLVLARWGLPWVGVAACYFARTHAPSREGAVSGRYPGLVLFAGLVLVLFGLPAGAWPVAAGAVGGLVTLGLTAARQRPVTPRLLRIQCR